MSREFCALIMAGGKGTRFWPKSTEEKPKQFLRLIGEKTMIQMTVDRVRKVMPIEKIFIVTCSKYVSLLKEQIPDLPEKNIIIEPVGRNTAPCILLASMYIKQIYNEVNIAVLPSDHIMNKEEEFCNILKDANIALNEKINGIITIGIKPDRPETGYGYIECSNDIEYVNERKVVKVNRFVEKPNLEKAKEYLEKGNYLWNAGMFIFDVNYMLKELERNFNEGYNIISKLPYIYESQYTDKLNEEYPKCEAISIDYAVMEKSNAIYVIPSDFGWDDVGTWNSLERYIQKDENMNIAKGNVEFSNSNNCIAYTENKKVILIDVDDIFVTEGEDTIVICKKQSIDKVKNFRK